MTVRASARERVPVLRRAPLWALAVVLIVVLLTSMVIAIGIGPVAVPVGDVVDAVTRHLGGAGPAGRYDFIVWELRVPRVLQGAAVGAGLAVAGLLTQAMTGNPLGDPYVLGLSSGAAVGAVLVLTTAGSAVLGVLTVPVAAFLGALAAATLVFALARNGSRTPPARLVMTGIALAQLLSGVVSFLLLTTQNSNAQQQVLFWLLGSLAGTQWPLASVGAVAIGLLIVAAAAGSSRLNLLVLGDDGAAALGLNSSRLRLVLLVLVTLLTGTAVAVAGSIGFLGLVVPNLTRLLVGADHRRAVPVGALLGALILVWADTAARVVLAPTETPIGILTAVFGVPVFLLVLRRSATGTAGLT
ncbi:iron ABC transporter permease [Amycolatopsis rhabdoformis]|uniref:Iron ABC transporter permease n=1 Tax=Amycolatopsis rhabdoformis TaxID=1448059 RepID=A0ABZ1IGK3_9PSEU|nr:iron ABC transporter permease [Amycolatopsis rhabdoformis]WSE33590.1 iron ABC transporter permease [Amycolatopsis rhabdoformis]